MTATAKQGCLLVMSGPSGAGKSTLCRPLLESEATLEFSVSCTTRSPRPGEVDGIDYFFVSREEFLTKIEESAFLEYAEVHGNFYGTLKSAVEARMLAGFDVLLDIDVQGAIQIQDYLKAGTGGDTLATHSSFIFVGPPSYDALESRLRGRGTEEEEVIQRRLHNARTELTFWTKYDFLVVNDDLEVAREELKSVLYACRCKVPHLKVSGPGDCYS